MNRSTCKPHVNYITGLIALMMATMPVYAGFENEIITLIAGNKPDGVLFEIVSGNNKALDTALPRITRAVKQLRKKWPDLDIVVVSHGKEQFALTRSNSKKHMATQQQVKDLTSRDNVNVHVCGAYAQLHNISEDEFPDYVDVSAHGPEQIRDYRMLGYRVIKLGNN